MPGLQTATMGTVALAIIIDYGSRPFERVIVVAMVVVVFYVGFIGFQMGANGGRAQMGVDTIRSASESSRLNWAYLV